MRIQRLLEDGTDHLRVEAAGNATRGSLFVDEHGIVRWVSDVERLRMHGDGVYSGATGYSAYDDTHVTA